LRLGSCLLPRRKREDEYASATWAVAERQIAAHASGETSRQGETYADAAGFPRDRIVNAVETLEDAFLVTRRYSGAAVHEADFAPFDLDVDLPIGVFQGI
jgi:hypothetical protein